MSEYVQPELPGMESITSMDQVIDVELDGVGYDLVRELNVCNDAIDKWEQRRKAAHEALLKDITGGAETEARYVATFNGKSVAHLSVYKERRFSTKAFQSDHPVLFDSYRIESMRKRLIPDRTIR